jgi:hypothetical protein
MPRRGALDKIAVSDYQIPNFEDIQLLKHSRAIPNNIPFVLFPAREDGRSPVVGQLGELGHRSKSKIAQR